MYGGPGDVAPVMSTDPAPDALDEPATAVTTGRAPANDLAEARRVSLLVGLLFGLAGLGSSSAAIALPVLAQDMGVSTGVSAWVISLYALLLGVATAVYGRVSDLVGIRGPLLFGVGLMTTGAVIAALAPVYWVLLAGRILQGAGVAAIPTLGVAIVSARFTGSVRAVALGRIAGVAAAISCLGPLAGGVVADLAGWRAVIALPILGVLAVPFLFRSLPTEGTGARLDVLGAVLVAATAAGLVMLVQSPSTGPVVGLVGAVLLSLSVPAVAWWVRRRPHGFLPRSVLHNAVVVRSSMAAAAVPAAWFALLIAVPASWSPTGGGPGRSGSRSSRRR